MLIQPSKYRKKFISRLKDSTGVSRLTVLVFGTIFAVAFYCAYHIIPFYYYYFELVNQMEGVVRLGDSLTDVEILQKLAPHLRMMEIPASIEDIKIIRSDDSINISLNYNEIFYITWDGKDYDLHTFNFKAEAVGRF